jgi:SAM-dependent methyltransferase
MKGERDYILGTHDEEIERLGLQHRVWRARTLDSWRRAGFTVGQTILDIGCGPGYASIDLAGIVGPSGRVVAMDRSRRFLDALESFRDRLELPQIEPHELDLDEAALPEILADGAWTRWVFAFVKRPRELLERVAKRMKPGATWVLYEYFDYSTWQFAPHSPVMDEFVQAVMEGWRAAGGEPDIGLDLPRWLGELGFDLRRLHPIIDVVKPKDYAWQWPKAFEQVGLDRMIDLGLVTRERGRTMAEEFAARETDPQTLVITPAVLEIIAVRR